MDVANFGRHPERSTPPVLFGRDKESIGAQDQRIKHESCQHGTHRRKEGDYCPKKIMGGLPEDVTTSFCFQASGFNFVLEKKFLAARSSRLRRTKPVCHPPIFVSCDVRLLVGGISIIAHERTRNSRDL